VKSGAGFKLGTFYFDCFGVCNLSRFCHRMRQLKDMSFVINSVMAENAPARSKILLNAELQSRENKIEKVLVYFFWNEFEKMAYFWCNDLG
jgi:hypothetical protein